MIAGDDLARDTVAVVLAGGKGTRLGPLTQYECKPALPFGAAGSANEPIVVTSEDVTSDPVRAYD